MPYNKVNKMFKEKTLHDYNEVLMYGKSYKLVLINYWNVSTDINGCPLIKPIVDPLICFINR